jgi:hypothetical protein
MQQGGINLPPNESRMLKTELAADAMESQHVSEDSTVLNFVAALHRLA